MYGWSDSRGGLLYLCFGTMLGVEAQQVGVGSGVVVSLMHHSEALDNRGRGINQVSRSSP